MVAFGHATAGLTFCGQDIDPLHHTDILVVESGRFADDSPLEGERFEPSVPRKRDPFKFVQKMQPQGVRTTRLYERTRSLILRG